MFVFFPTTFDSSSTPHISLEMAAKLRANCKLRFVKDQTVTIFYDSVTIGQAFTCLSINVNAQKPSKRSTCTGNFSIFFQLAKRITYLVNL